MLTQQTELETFLAAAVEIADAAERDAYIERVSAGDARRREALRGMVRDYFAAGALLDKPAVVVATIGHSTEQVGSQIGRYKLLEQIGEGGMGIVFVAEQTEPVRRRVALKIIKPGMDTKQVIARFEAERQALAMMDHPNIARVLDAGTTEPGRPYFVMELVRGMPITEYCDKARLAPRGRLELFVNVCQAVQHAHQKGIIHRDLKPSNVLVTLHDGTPVVKVIDFGVAKAVGQQLTERTIYTALTQLVGTPLYMSPEQAEMSGLDVDTRSDVYSLGVLLYELLTGQTPFDKETLAKAGLDEMRRMIREDEPETVSARLARTRRTGTRGLGLGVNASHGTGLPSAPNPESLTPRMSELDWIVMKALEKDRTRRYESASALAADIQRYLSDEPVLACPPTTMYRFQKFARKHKPALATAVAIAASLILGTTVSAWQAARATTAEVQANANEAQAKEAAAAEAQQRQRAEANEQKASTQRDEAQRQRDEVKSLNEKLAAKEQQLQRSLYASNMNLAKNAWDAGNIERVNELLDQHRPKPRETDLRGFEWHYLHRLGHSELLTLKGLPSSVTSMAYSPDGKRIAGTSRREMKLWDAQTGQELLSFKDSCDGITFSPDGRRLAAGSWVDEDPVVKVWDSQTGQELLSLKGHTSTVGTVAFSPDGKRLAGGPKYSSILDGTVKVWDAQTGQELLTVKNAGGFVVFSPDGQCLATARGQGGGKVWDAQTGNELLALQDLQGHEVWSMAYSPDGKYLASGSGNGATIWDAATGKELRSLKGPCVAVDIVTFSPDGKWLAGGSWRGTVQIWESETGQEIRAFKGGGGVVTFSPDGQRIASNTADNTIKVWDAYKDQEFVALEAGGGWRGNAFSPDFKRLASAFLDGTVKVRDVQTGQLTLTLKGHTLPAHCVTFSPDGKRLVSGGGGKRNAGGGWGASADDPAELKVWDAETGDELLSMPAGQTLPIVSVAFSPDGKHVASASAGRLSGVKVWDAQTGQELLTLKPSAEVGGGGPPAMVAYSPDGTQLACGRGGGVTVWNAESGKELLSLKGGGGSSVAFSPDGRHVASCGKVWDAQTGKEVHALKGRAGNWCMTFSPDGKRLASGSQFEVKVWDAQTGQELLTFGEWNTNTVAFSPNGHCLTSIAQGTVKIYDATPLPEKP